MERHVARDLNEFSQHFPNGNSFHRHNYIFTLQNSRPTGMITTAWMGVKDGKEGLAIRTADSAHFV